MKIHKKTIGIIGGGQLGMMLTESAKKLSEYISDIIVLDPTNNCPASNVGAKQIIANYDDENAIYELAKKSDIITYEIETGNIETLHKLEKSIEINPSPQSLQIIQDKFKQKKFLAKNKLPVPEFDDINTFTEFKTKSTQIGFPLMIKARRGGYDGRGNTLIKSNDNITKKISSNTFFLEKIIDFKMEVSVIVVRNIQGDIITYPTVENIHYENILRMTIAPARIQKNISDQAQKIATNAIKCFSGAGVFCVEMFITKNNNILINEIAPRVHNSGHHTLQSSSTSQFEQHLRAILGLRLGSTKLLHKTIMYNILGPKNFQGKFKPISINKSGIFVKMYNKHISKPLRKLGHVNIIMSDENNIDSLFQKFESIKELTLIRPL